MSSIRHRGTPERPGLVLGLVPGGECRGLVYEVGHREADAVMAYLDDREMAESGYRAIWADVETPSGRRKAFTYVGDEASDGGQSLDPEALCGRIISAGGHSGSNLDYALKTLSALEDIFGRDLPEMETGFCSRSLSTLKAASTIRPL